MSARGGDSAWFVERWVNTQSQSWDVFCRSRFECSVSSTADVTDRATSQSSYVVIAWGRVVVANDQNF